MYYYRDDTDDYIIDFVTNNRKRTLKSDFLRHVGKIAKIYFGFGGGYTKKDIPRLMEWAMRLYSIMHKVD